MSGSTHALSVAIFLPGRFARLDQAARYRQVLQKCPCCSSDLVVMTEKFGDLAGGHVMSGGWYCGQCGLHLVPGEEVKLFSMAEKILPRTPTQSASDLREAMVNHDTKPDASPGERGPQIRDQPTPKSVAEVQGTRRSNSTNLGEDFSKLERQIQDQLGDFMVKVRTQHSQREQQLDEIQHRLMERKRHLDREETNYQKRLAKLAEVEQRASKKDVHQSSKDQSATSPSKAGRVFPPEPRDSKDVLESGYCSGYATSSSQETNDAHKHNRPVAEKISTTGNFTRSSVSRQVVGHSPRGQPYVFRYSTNSLTSNSSEDLLMQSENETGRSRISPRKNRVLFEEHSSTRDTLSKARELKNRNAYKKERVSPPHAESLQNITDRERRPERMRSSSLGNVLMANHQDISTPKKDSNRVFVSAEGSWLDVTPQTKDKNTEIRGNTGGPKSPSPIKDRRILDKEYEFTQSLDSASQANRGMTVSEYMSRRSPVRGEHYTRSSKSRLTSPESVSPRKVSPVKLGTSSHERLANPDALSQMRSRPCEGNLSATSKYITNPRVRGKQVDPNNIYQSKLLENRNKQLPTDRYSSKLSPRKELFPPKREYLTSPSDGEIRHRSLSSCRSRSAGQVISQQPVKVMARMDMKRSSSTDVLGGGTPLAHSSPNRVTRDYHQTKGATMKTHSAHSALNNISSLNHSQSARPGVKPKPSVASLTTAFERSPDKLKSPERYTQGIERSNERTRTSHRNMPQYQTARVSPDKTIKVVPSETSNTVHVIHSRKKPLQESRRDNIENKDTIHSMRQRINPERYQLFGRAMNTNNSNNQNTGSTNTNCSEFPESSTRAFRTVKQRRRSRSMDVMHVDHLRRDVPDNRYLFKPIKSNNNSDNGDILGTLL